MQIGELLDPFLFEFRLGKHMSRSAFKDVKTDDDAREAMNEPLLKHVDASISKARDAADAVEIMAFSGAELQETGCS